MNALAPADWLGLFLHFMMLSMLSIGGAVTTVPEMHRYVVEQHCWIDDTTFASSVALAQAAPGPNVLLVPAVGYQIAGWMGAFVTLAGMLIPSTVLSLSATRWMRSHREERIVRAFVAGVMPVTLGLLMATGWTLARALTPTVGLVLLVVLSALLTWRTKFAPWMLVAVGALAGALGLV